jgi:hypothetical protein
MKKLIGGGLVALALGLVAAPVAGADANDDAFIEATDRVIYGGNAIDGDRWWGYPDVPAQIRIDAAKEACAMMDAGNADGSKVNDYLVAALGPRKHAGYFAAWFEQSAITHYCSQHSDRIGII